VLSAAPVLAPPGKKSKTLEAKAPPPPGSLPKLT